MVKSIRKNAILNILKNLLSIMFPLVSFPYVSRILQPEGIGKVDFSRSIVSYFSIISMLGIMNYGIRESAKIRDNRYLLSKFVKEIFLINIVTSIIAYILFFVALFSISFFKDYTAILLVASSSILFNAMGIEWLYTALEEFSYITIRAFVFQLISLFLMFLLVRNSNDSLIYCAILVFSNVGANVCNFWHSRKFIDYGVKSIIEIKKHLKPMLIMFAMTVTSCIYTVLDTSMLGFISGDVDVGLYSAANKITRIVVSLVVAASSVLLPRLSYYINNESMDMFNSLVKKGFRFLFALSLPCSVGLALVSESVISLFCGVEYSGAILTMRVLAPIILFIGISNFIGVQLFLPLNKEKLTFVGMVIGSFFNLLLNCIFIPRIGALGAAISSVIAEMIVAFVQLFFARHIIEIKNLLLIFLKYLLNSVVMGVVVYLVYKNINNEILKLLVSIILGGCVYILLLLFEKDIVLLTIIKNKSLRSF